MYSIRAILKTLPSPALHSPVTYSSPAVGCSYWVTRRFATRQSKQDIVFEDEDLFGEADTKLNYPTANVIEDGVEIDQVEPKDESSISNDVQGSTTKDQLLHRPKLPGSIKRLNRILSRQRQVEIPESELDEKFVRGRGPGGQAINKTNSSVSLIHIPTGIRIQSQPTRSREENRKVARRILSERLEVLRTTGQLPGYDLTNKIIDLIPQDQENTEDGLITKKKSKKQLQKQEEKVLSGSYTKKEIKAEKERRRKLNRAKKSKKKYGKKGEESNEEEIDSNDELGETVSTSVKEEPKVVNDSSISENTRV